MAADITELVGRCLAGDERAVRQFVDRFQQVVFALCLRMLGHRHDAEDATQETMLRALRNLHRWDASRPLLPWLTTIAANRCRTALSQRGQRPHVTDSIPHAADNSVNPDHELAEELQQALEQLRDDYQHCFRLFYEQELNCVQIGEVMGVPEGTVKTWLHRARRELAEHLRRRGLSPEGQHELHRI